jgi:hypothetical protein
VTGKSLKLTDTGSAIWRQIEAGTATALGGSLKNIQK